MRLQERRPTIFETSDLVPAIREWLERSHEPSTTETNPFPTVWQRAVRVGDLLRADKLEAAASALETDAYGPDVLHAMIELTDANRDDVSTEHLADLERTYALVATISWPDEFDERSEMLARLSFLGWNSHRLAGNYVGTQLWESRCSKHSLEQEHVRNFIELPPSARTESVCSRFLTDEAVVLAICERLDRERLTRPQRTNLEAAQLYSWLSSGALVSTLNQDLLQFIAARVALIVAGVQLRLGSEESRSTWFRRFVAHSSRCNEAGALAAKGQYHLLARDYYLDRYAEIVDRAPAVASELSERGMHEDALRARLIMGRALRLLSRWEPAMACLERVRLEAVESGDVLAEALSLCDLAHLASQTGNTMDSLVLVRAALDAARRSECDWAVADVQATCAAILRDAGDFHRSVEAWEAAIESNERIGFVSQAAYLRVLLAESLLITARPEEAMAQVLAAIPIIVKNQLAHEAVAAMGILKEAIRRHQSDPDALRQLREQLQEMHREDKL